MNLDDDGVLIEGRELSKTYRGARGPALDGVSVRVKAGEIVGIIGPNGSGKTTLMACLLGLLKPDRGEARLGGSPVTGLAAKRLIGYLPERLGFDPWMQGAAFLAYHHALAGLPAADRTADVEARLREVGLDPAAWTRRLSGYSRGMLQRIGLAQALIGAPRCLFLDEPTSGMDPEGVLKVRGLVQAFAASGGAVLVNSHQLEQLGKLCHQVLFLKQGRLEGGERLRGGEGLDWSVAWLPAPDAPPDAEAKARAVLGKLGLEQARFGPSFLRVQVEGEQAAAGLVAALVKAGLPVLSAGPTSGTLERFFTGEGHADS